MFDGGLGVLVWDAHNRCPRWGNYDGRKNIPAQQLRQRRVRARPSRRRGSGSTAKAPTPGVTHRRFGRGLAALDAFFFGIRGCIEKLVKPDSHVAKVEAAVATGRLPLDGHFSRFGRLLPSDLQDWNGSTTV
jgi:hypothetical protein